jgi:hypothetical protein
MRLSIVIALGALAVGLASSCASAETGRITSRQYPACSCQFGYPGRACVPTVACASEGGQCMKSCVQEPARSEAE